MFTLLRTEGHARRGIFETVHGTIQTPFFMNVGTAAAIKGGISSIDLANELKCQVELCNTYHLAQANSHRQRRISSVLFGKASPYPRGRRLLPVPYRR